MYTDALRSNPKATCMDREYYNIDSSYICVNCTCSPSITDSIAIGVTRIHMDLLIPPKYYIT